jgi:glycerol-3-phosphate dehydrogenase
MAQRYDLIVVGGGIQGAGVARDAALRGLQVALFERGDLAGETSSRSSKLIHGGMRYLEHLRFGLVREALGERALLLRLAPHLVWPCPFLLPFYEKEGRPRWMVEAGLLLYQMLAGRRAIGRIGHLSARAALEVEPELPRAKLRGAGLYLDAQMDDARLCLENALDAAQHGAAIHVHHEVTAITREGDEWLVRAQNRLEGDAAPVEATAPAVINAAGPWADLVRARAGRRGNRLRPSRGAHIVVRALTRRNAMLLRAHDGRAIFIVPMEGVSLVGTTESPEKRPLDEVTPTVSDLAYLIREVRRRWSSRVQNSLDVQRAFAAVRPLGRGFGPLGFASREAHLLREGGLYTMIGGKYTTYRAIAEHTLDRALRRLGRTAGPCVTRERTLPGGEWGTREQATEQARAMALDLRHMGAADAERLGARYGGRFPLVAAAIEEHPEEISTGGVRLRDGEVTYAVHAEMARRLDDVLMRRLGLWTDRRALRAASVPVSLIMARELGWSQARTNEEVSRLEQRLMQEETLVSAALQTQ